MKLPDWGKRPGVTILLTLAACAALGILSLLFAMKTERWAMLAGYFSVPLIPVLNLLPGILLAALLFALTGRACPAFLLTAAVVMGGTWVNWFKLQFRNDPLVFEDLILLREAGDMAGKYQMFIPKGLIVTVLCILLGGLALYGCARWKPSRRVRLAVAAAALVLLFPLRTLYFSDNVYTELTRSDAISSQWDSTKAYQSKGFVYPFLHSMRSAVSPSPDGYNADTSAARLREFPESAIPDEKKVNILAIMLESYCDFTDVPNAPELSPEVYAPLHALEAEGISGKLVTNLFAGGTIDSERGFLSGYPIRPAFREPTNTYVWYLRGQGYRTTGNHPGNAWFYQREAVNARMGFEDFRFLENHYGNLAGGGIAPDDLLFPELLRLCGEMPEPWFSFTVTYQGHGPYPDDRNVWGGSYLTDAGYSPEEYNILNNYFGSAANTSRNLSALAEQLRSSDSPTVLLVFGDHKPWLGNNESVYHSLGIPIGCDTPEGFLCHYSTQYLIWGNDAAKAVLGRDLQGEGPTIGPSMLMCTLFDALGWDGPPLMQQQRKLMENGVTMYHSVAGNVLFDGTLCDAADLPDAVQTQLREHLCDAYYEQTHFRYDG